jgi:hypothetical protein
MNLVDVTQRRDIIIARNNIYCPLCNQLQHSAFDKLYTVAFNKCVDCSTPVEVLDNGDKIFTIIGGWND